jgi:hypothetical protein
MMQDMLGRIVLHVLVVGIGWGEFVDFVKLPLIQKLKLIVTCKFNHLINTLTLYLTCELKLSFNKWGLTREIFNWNVR